MIKGFSCWCKFQGGWRRRECSEGSVPRLGSSVHHFYNRPLVNRGLHYFNLISREIEKCIILVHSGRGNEIPEHLVNLCHKDFPGSPMVKTLPSNTGVQDQSLVSKLGSQMPQGQKKKKPQNIKQKQYCNKFNPLKKCSTSKNFFKKLTENHFLKKSLAQTSSGHQILSSLFLLHTKYTHSLTNEDLEVTANHCI